jgi:hypothetical protein
VEFETVGFWQMAERKTTSPYLKSKIQIGNANSSVNHQLNETVFHGDDIDAKTRQRKEEIKAWKRSSQQRREQAEWDQSIKTNEKFLERRTRENFVHDRSYPYQYNYRAEKLGPKLQPTQSKLNKFQINLTQQLPQHSQGEDRVEDPRGQTFSANIQTFKRTQEMPIHPKFTEKKFEEEFNLSSKVNPKEFTTNLQQLTQHSRQQTLKKTTKLKNYMSPMERSIAFQEEVRKQKRQGEFTLEKHVFHPPEEPINRKALVNSFAVEPSLKFKTNHHTGVWELNKTEGRSVSSSLHNALFLSLLLILSLSQDDVVGHWFL